MAYSSYVTAGRGYDLSLFETSGTAAKRPVATKAVKKKQQKNNIVVLPDVVEDKALRRKHNVAGLIFGFIMASIIVVVVGIMIHGQVQLAEINQEITAAQAELENSRSEYIQIQARVDASLSTATVEEYARTQLGMEKASNQQKEYISLAESEKARIFAQDEGVVFDESGKYLGAK